MNSSSDPDNASLAVRIPVNRTEEYGSSSSLIAVSSVTLILNVAMLLILCKEKSAQSSFSVYITVLLSTNILYACTGNTMDILTQQNGNVWWLGDRLCFLYIYAIYIISGITIHSHALIVINRLWALFLPVSYKIRHTTRTAWLLCGIMILYVHVILLPNLVLDAVYHRQADACQLNTDAQWEWSVFMMVWIFDAPVVFIIGSYPFLLWKQVQRNRALKKIHSGTVASTRSTAGSTMNRTADYADIHASHKPGNVMINRKKSRPFVMLTFLTIGIMFCYAPCLAYYTLGLFITLDYSDPYYQATTTLYALQALLDPIFFALSFSALRSYIVSWWKR